MCGMDYPLKVSALGESGPLGYDDEPPLPPSGIPNNAMPQHWPVVESGPLPPPQYGASQSYPAPPPQYGAPYPSSPQYGGAQYGQPQYGQPQYGGQQSQYGEPQYGATPPSGPMSLTPPGIADPQDDEADAPDGPPDGPAGPPAPYDGAPARAPAQSSVPTYGSPPAPEPLGPPAAPAVTGAAGPVEVKPAATLACPIVSELDRWISAAVQPAALRWFQQPVVEIKQISSYSCRGMNGNPNAHISEHAFGNALDIAEFTLADGHKISVQYGWHGAPEEQGFLHDVQAAACQEFTTVLAPGANVYHYNHIHVDLMRHNNSRHICEPAAISGEVAAERARGHYAQHNGDPAVTGSIKSKSFWRPFGYSNDDDRLPVAVPGDD